MEVDIPNVWEGLFGRECLDFMVAKDDSCSILVSEGERKTQEGGWIVLAFSDSFSKC